MLEKDFKNRIIETLKIVESRGYNLTKEKLATQLLGGKVSNSQIESHIKSMKNIDFDDVFIATKGNLNLQKCKSRKEKNIKLNHFFLKIAKEFAADYIQICPWVYCIMVTGSVASEGVCEEDDIDLNIVVEDNSKFFSYLIAILLSLKYSIKYKKKFFQKYLRFITKVICISVIWEKHQVMPFIRRDEQIAYELLNVKVIYNYNFFKKIVDNNSWLSNFFPQIFEENKYYDKNDIDNNIILIKKKCPILFEKISFILMLFLYRVIRFSRSKNIFLRERMELVEKVKYPYGIFDKP